MFKYQTAYFCGYAKLPNSLPTVVVNGSLTLGLEINLEKGTIVGVSSTLLSPFACDLVKTYFMGKHVVNDYDQIVEEITYRHQGIASKPMIKAYSDIRRNYMEYMKANEDFLRS